MSEKQDFFLHRPISINVKHITRMSHVRDFPASETLMTVHVKIDQKTQKHLLKILIESITADEPLDLIALTISGTSP